MARTRVGGGEGWSVMAAPAAARLLACRAWTPPSFSFGKDHYHNRSGAPEYRPWAGKSLLLLGGLALSELILAVDLVLPEPGRWLDHWVVVEVLGRWLVDD